ncbi:alpha-(1,3)-fucosyltransferase C [Amyelois transitella]|uniref:alpha-(1,3)-fucosyltransferase C n=1 Tax=Amyelois transitella TaxID=680683 RepID=UPI00067DC0F9|nr:alpha-(1,3)-fucosyltransferase C [Amyelois transitella]
MNRKIYIQKCAKIIAVVLLLSVLLFIEKYLLSADADNVCVQPNPDYKYVLLWTSPKTEPFVFIGPGRSGFIGRNCSYTNCYVTADRDYFCDYTKFHAIVFAMSEVRHYSSLQLPWYRSPEQKYVFSSVESSHYYPVCSDRFNDYFNWTWSYRLDSNCRWEYIAIRNENGNVIGPNKIMHWMKLNDMRPVSEDFKDSLKSKTKAAAWFASNCPAYSHREKFVEKLQMKLNKYRLKIDIYGKCGNLTCPRQNRQLCLDMIKKDYYFYLSFENSFSEDYVTEKLLHALQNDAVPIVYGKANYTRFMPDGIYLNALTLGPEKLAKEMNYLINNPKKYADYFKWKNHYSYHSRGESEETDDYCAFCKLLNDEEKFRRKSVIEDFRKWWDSPKFC